MDVARGETSADQKPLVPRQVRPVPTRLHCPLWLTDRACWVVSGRACRGSAGKDRPLSRAAKYRCTVRGSKSYLLACLLFAWVCQATEIGPQRGEGGGGSGGEFVEMRDKGPSKASGR